MLNNTTMRKHFNGPFNNVKLLIYLERIWIVNQIKFIRNAEVKRVDVILLLGV